MVVFESLLPERLDHGISFSRLTWEKSQMRVRYHPFSHSAMAGRHEKVVSLSIFNASLCQDESEVSHIYLMGCLQNAILKQFVYKEWAMIIYVDRTSWKAYPKLYEKYFVPILKRALSDVYIVQVDLRTTTSPRWEKAVRRKYPDIDQYHSELGWDLSAVEAHAARQNDDQCESQSYQFIKTLYRFFPSGYHMAMISRDADARINVREEVATHEWLHSTYPFSRMFDNPGHANPFLAGMWGSKSICRNVLRDFNIYGSCKVGDAPVQNVMEKFLSYVNRKKIATEGYGVDEKFLGELDDRLKKSYYESVITYGKGAYYAGSSVYSPFADRRSLKIGRRMMTLMPAKGPDTVHGDHQSLKNFEMGEEDSPVIGRDVYFVGEDLPIRASVPSEMIDYLIYQTLRCNKASRDDFSLSTLKSDFVRFKIPLDYKEFRHHVFKTNLITFQRRYGFDKRVLPALWYCFMSGTNDHLPFIETFGTFNPNDYEVQNFESASRDILLRMPKVQKALFSGQSVKSFSRSHDKIVSALKGEKPGSIKIGGVDMASYFGEVGELVRKHSRVYAYLEEFEADEFFSELTNVYPIDALKNLSLPF